MDLHLSVSGALTGDMFAAAILDAFPHHEDRVVTAIDAVDAAHPVACALLPHSDLDVSGRRFEVVPFERYFGHIPFAFSQERLTRASALEQLRAAQINQAIRTHATKIFELAATDTADLTPWLSMAQVMSAAALIDALGPARWTMSPMPPGTSATPTATAILDYLCPPRNRGQPLPRMRSLARTGTGFGSPAAANTYLRLLCFDEGSAAFREPDISAQVPMPATGRSGQRPAQ
jgi:hypothetical protein